MASLRVAFVGLLALMVAFAAPPLTEVNKSPFPQPIFNCSKLPKPAPVSNVSEVKPGHIKVVMAMGDSITAGFAMEGVVTRLLEHRGKVFDIGGDEGALTIPNFLTALSGEEPVGVAHGDTIPLVKGAFLDAAVSMAQSRDIPAQAEFLVAQLNGTYKADFSMADDWKMLSVMIGANDDCNACKKNLADDKANYKKNVKKGIDIMLQQVPKLIVNFILFFDISDVWRDDELHWYCKTVQGAVKECGCFNESDEDPKLLDEMDKHAAAYRDALVELADEYNALGRQDFAVRVQPGFLGFPAMLKKYGYHAPEYFLSVDCFHPNTVADSAFAIGLWNNLFEPAGNKSTAIDPEHPYLTCPTPDSVLM